MRTHGGVRTKPDANIRYIASPTCAQFHASNASTRILLGAIGSGKSSATWIELFSTAMVENVDANGRRVVLDLCVRDTYAQLKMTSIKDYLSWFGHIATVVYDAPIRGHLVLPLADGTTLDWTVWFLSMDGGEDSLNTLRGMSIRGAYFNEAHTLSQDVWDVVNTRIDRHMPCKIPNKWAGIVADSNFGYEGCHLHKLFNDPPLGYEFFVQPPAAIYNPRTGKYELNPNAENLAHLAPNYYAKQLGANVEFVKQFLANTWATKHSGKAIWPEFNSQRHVIKHWASPDPYMPIIIGQDFGLHAASIFCQFTRQGKLVVIDEVFHDDCDLETYINQLLLPRIRTKYSTNKVIVVGDPAGNNRSGLDKRTAFQILQAANINATMATTNDFNTRRDAVASFLTRNEGFGIVAKDCPRLLKALEGAYGYKKKPDGTFSDAADKNIYSHVADALQYAAMFCRFGATQITGAQTNFQGKYKTRRKGNSTNVNTPNMWTG